MQPAKGVHAAEHVVEGVIGHAAEGGTHQAPDGRSGAGFKVGGVGDSEPGHVPILVGLGFPIRLGSSPRYLYLLCRDLRGITSRSAWLSGSCAIDLAAWRAASAMSRRLAGAPVETVITAPQVADWLFRRQQPLRQPGAPWWVTPVTPRGGLVMLTTVTQ